MMLKFFCRKPKISIFMPFIDTNSHLTTKPSNFDIKCYSNSESYDRHGFFGTNFRGGQNFLFTLGGFFNEREYSEADCPDLLISYNLVIQFDSIRVLSKLNSVQCTLYDVQCEM